VTSYAALIRGIGPGDPRKSNASLVGVLGELGLHDVKPVISSGNVIFTSDSSDSDGLADRIEAAWPELRGFQATTIVRSKEQIQRLLDQAPFGEVEHGKSSYQLVTFFKRPTNRAETPPPELGLEVVSLVDGALCTVSDTTKSGTPDAMSWLEKTYGKEITSRTPLTLQRILTKMQ